MLPSNPWTTRLAQVCRLIPEPTVLAFLPRCLLTTSSDLLSCCECSSLAGATIKWSARTRHGCQALTSQRLRQVLQRSLKIPSRWIWLVLLWALLPSLTRAQLLNLADLGLSSASPCLTSTRTDNRDSFLHPANVCSAPQCVRDSAKI